MTPKSQVAPARAKNLAKAREASKVMLEEVPDPQHKWLLPIDEEAEAAPPEWSDFEEESGEDLDEVEKGWLHEHNESDVTFFAQVLTAAQPMAVKAENAKRKTNQKCRYTKNTASTI
ncbi:hypothetical protein BC835DRAFT_1411601 [Cytidiella melzeri]|nr:hypothetical protein BC835DRAFT_1411601 [Cytidiella melzeri]